ncbi:hypothetical protein VTK73DRAFT_53 [Phialemonium thermophilum]|uniref:Small ribosomal subunit protein mS33 n=1 Tax=Phialemonium thermophilum TaxID=223376 RepID=A0ABR3YA63_9PEZI
MSVPRSRLLELTKLQCELFSTVFNPDGVRTGNKILRQRLRGPTLASYYPRRVVTFRDFLNEFKQFQVTTENEKEVDRLEHIAGLKFRGKGKPKKKSGPDTSPKKK